MFSNLCSVAVKLWHQNSLFKFAMHHRPTEHSSWHLVIVQWAEDKHLAGSHTSNVGKLWLDSGQLSPSRAAENVFCTC